MKFLLACHLCIKKTFPSSWFPNLRLCCVAHPSPSSHQQHNQRLRVSSKSWGQRYSLQSSETGGGCNNISAAQEGLETAIILKRKEFATTSFHNSAAKLSNLGGKGLTKRSRIRVTLTKLHKFCVVTLPTKYGKVVWKPSHAMMIYHWSTGHPWIAHFEGK